MEGETVQVMEKERQEETGRKGGLGGQRREMGGDAVVTGVQSGSRTKAMTLLVQGSEARNRSIAVQKSTREAVGTRREGGEGADVGLQWLRSEWEGVKRRQLDQLAGRGRKEGAVAGGREGF